MLARLPVLPAPPSQGLAALPDLPGLPAAARAPHARARTARAQADAALQAFLTAVWAEATDFVFDAAALRAAVRRARGRRLRRLRALASCSRRSTAS